MATFVAQQAVDMANLSELGLFSNFKQLNTPSVTLSSKFTASKGKISMLVTGHDMTAVFKVPKSGTFDGIAVTVSNVPQYQLTNLNLPFGKMQSIFSGNFEPGLFSKADTITGSGKTDKLRGYDGGDHIRAGGGDDTAAGGKGPDDIYGQSGDDTLNGNAGNDILDGGPGRNTLTGGNGKDMFLFDSQLAKGNLSTITDFKPGADHFQLDNVAFPGIGGRGPLPGKKFVDYSDYDGQDDVVVYNQPKGIVYYQLTSGSLGNAIPFAKVTPGLALDNSDFMIV